MPVPNVTAGSSASSPRRVGRLVIAASVLAMTGLAGLTGAPAAAASAGVVTITGHGYGHGRGMSQWGAFGYATSYRWSFRRILAHYYGGTSLSQVKPTTISVALSHQDGASSVVVTSGRPFTVGGVVIPAGGAVRVTYRAPGRFELGISARCGVLRNATRIVGSGLITPSSSSPGDDVSAMLTICDDQNRSYRGSLAVVHADGANHLVNTLAIEDYLRGVVPRESPASWGDAAGGAGMAALQAQAVAARSYASTEHRYPWAQICDSQNCQVYGGAARSAQLIEDPRSDAAVAATRGQVLVDPGNGRPVSAEYSSSSGGWTSGGQFPAVEDKGDTASPNHNWSVTMASASVRQAFDVGTITSITVLSRNGLGADGGRVLLVRVAGTAGSVRVTGAQFASALGLKSDWFSVRT
jgi:SpoIID/LytB domain protein